MVLDAADENELRRLPGIGERRANAILSLRARLGRFRAVEDLSEGQGHRPCDPQALATAPSTRRALRDSGAPTDRLDRKSQRFDQGRDAMLPKLVRGAIDDKHAGDGRDVLEDNQAVLRERLPALDNIHDEVREADDGRELDRTLKVDHVGLHAATREMLGRDARILGPDAGDARRRWAPGDAGDDHPADAHPEVQRPVQICGALHQDVATAHADVSGAVLDVRRHVVGFEKKEANAAPRETRAAGFGRPPGVPRRRPRPERAAAPPLEGPGPSAGPSSTARSSVSSLHALNLRPQPAELLLDASRNRDRCDRRGGPRFRPPRRGPR